MLGNHALCTQSLGDYNSVIYAWKFVFCFANISIGRCTHTHTHTRPIEGNHFVFFSGLMNLIGKLSIQGVNRYI